MKRYLSFTLALALVLALFVGTSFATEKKDLVTYELTMREMETFNVLFSQGAANSNVLTNCLDGLLSNNNYGRLVPGLAEKWGTEDGGLTWTFNLRNGLKWVDFNANEKADVVAEDFLWGLEWVLNFHKNDSANTSMPIAMIKGAEAYYNYTKELPAAEGLALDLTKFKEMVGIEAKDDQTLVYTCLGQFPYFATLATYNCLYPLSGKLLAEIGVDGYKAVNSETLWYNGPYTLTTFVHQNEKVLTKNPTYWNKEAKIFDTVTIKMLDSLEIALQMFQTGELDQVELSESSLRSIYENKSHEFNKNLVEGRPSKYSYQVHFVYDKKLKDGAADTNWNKAVANEAFRLTWYHGLDFTTFLSRNNAIHPLSCSNFVYTSANLVSTSDGKDYTKLVEERLGITPSTEKYARLNTEKAAAYKKQAMEELTAQGVTFPIVADYYIKSGNQTAADSAVVLQQMFKDCLGDDFVKIETHEYVSSITQEVRNPQLASFYLNGWGADFGDPLNFLGQETYGDDNAYYSVAYSKINNATDEKLIADYKEFTAMVKKAEAILDDTDARYNAFADAEAYMIQHAFVIPYLTDIKWYLTCVDMYSQIYGAYGIQNMRYVNWNTNDQIYTTEDYVKLAEAYEAAR